MTKRICYIIPFIYNFRKRELICISWMQNNVCHLNEDWEKCSRESKNNYFSLAVSGKKAKAL